jgi:uncharacterized protein (UPF0333 family)
LTFALALKSAKKHAMVIIRRNRVKVLLLLSVSLTLILVIAVSAAIYNMMHMESSISVKS